MDVYLCRMWTSLKSSYGTYLKLERNLSDHSIESYLRDVEHLTGFLEQYSPGISVSDVQADHLNKFISWLFELGIAVNSQARIVSGLRGFFRFLLMEGVIQKDPSELVRSPRAGRKLPHTLSAAEIDQMVLAIDLSTPEGIRNKAIIETLYSCGLRVTELIHLRLSNLFFDEGFIRILGKGDKERLVPISPEAEKHITIYVEEVRIHSNIQKGHEDYLFLNRFGKGLSRVAVFNIVKQLAKKAGMGKTVSPHTFRHSFATELIKGGANLRAVQEMLGHSSILTTEIYTHLDREFLRDTIRKYHPMSRKNTENPHQP